MIELLELTEAYVVATAVTMSVVTAPIVIMNGEEIPNIKPLVEIIEKNGETKS